MFDFCILTSPDRDGIARGIERAIAERDQMAARAAAGRAWAMSRYSVAAVGQSLNRVLLAATGSRPIDMHG
jgi:hypothetical protein